MTIISAVTGWLGTFAMPAESAPALRCAARTAVALAVILTGVSVACESRAVPQCWADLAAPAAGAAWVIAALCWVTAVRDDSGRRLLIRALGDALSRLPEDQKRDWMVQAVSRR